MTQSAELLSFPRSDGDRLRLALRKLEAALAEQKAAVSEFRANMAAMRDATSGLSAQMQRYNSTLGDTAQRVAQAGETARRLEQRADTMLSMG